MTATKTSWVTKIAASLPLMQWRRSRRWVRRHAAQLIDNHGEAAILRALERAWAAQGLHEAKFWHAVAAEIMRRIDRRAIIERLAALCA